MDFKRFLLENTKQDFVQHIIQDPFDDARRLVFADWLEEQGRDDEASIMRHSDDYPVIEDMIFKICNVK